MNILGVSCYYHDSAAALVQNGKLTAAVSEEAFTRKKHDNGFPNNAIQYCLKQAKMTSEDIDYVGFYEKPFLRFERLLIQYAKTIPRSFKTFHYAIPEWIFKKLWVGADIKHEIGYDKDIFYVEHHHSHAASTFFVSPFENAAILTVDGVGEWATTTMGIGRGNKIEIIKEIHFPHSLGLLYSAFTQYLGFRVNSGEYKVMGLAPYGKPNYYNKILEIIKINDDGSFWMDQKYFNYLYGLSMVNDYFCNVFDEPVRDSDEPLTQFHKDVAASVQKVLEDILMRLANSLYNETKMDALCMAGGVALNCVANSKILFNGPYKQLFVQPAASDAGGAVGAAYYIYNQVLNQPRCNPLEHVYLGPEFTNDEIKGFLDENAIPYVYFDDDMLAKTTAELIDKQKVIGWFQGRMEFGPRALGNRSILADARNPDNKDIVNSKIKFRESFRPFAPSVLEERLNEFFEINIPTPYMLLTAQVVENKRVIPSVTHVDGSARIQSVSNTQNPLYHKVLEEFYKLSNVPVIINTSFNIRGEPIVCTYQDAFRTFMSSGIDVIVLGNFLINKEKLPNEIKEKNWGIILTIPD